MIHNSVHVFPQLLVRKKRSRAHSPFSLGGLTSTFVKQRTQRAAVCSTLSRQKPHEFWEETRSTNPKQFSQLFYSQTSSKPDSESSVSQIALVNISVLCSFLRKCHLTSSCQFSFVYGNSKSSCGKEKKNKKMVIITSSQLSHCQRPEGEKNLEIQQRS